MAITGSTLIPYTLNRMHMFNKCAFASIFRINTEKLQYHQKFVFHLRTNFDGVQRPDTSVTSSYRT